jgi:hypothetical protein
MSNKYLYGIIALGDSVQLGLKGIAGERIYNVPYREIGAVVGDLNDSAYEPTEDHLLRHEEAVENVMESHPILPARFSTVLSTHDEVISLLKRHYDEFIENLKRVKGKVELGVKVIWPADEIKDALQEKKKDPNQGNLGVLEQGPGTRYLFKRLEEKHLAEGIGTEADRLIEAINGLLSPYAVDKRLRRLVTERMLLSASYLVERDRVDQFKDGFRVMQERFNQLKALYSGPWPPYNFVTIGESNGSFKIGRYDEQ